MKVFLNKDLFNLLEGDAKKYRKEALESIVRSRHMNDLTMRDIAKLRRGVKLFERTKDALLVDFINYVAAMRGCDLGLCVKHLNEKKRKGPGFIKN